MNRKPLKAPSPPLDGAPSAEPVPFLAVTSESLTHGNGTGKAATPHRQRMLAHLQAQERMFMRDTFLEVRRRLPLTTPARLMADVDRCIGLLAIDRDAT